MSIFIVIPTYNEAENIPLMTQALFALPLENLNLLIVDDGSPDGTGQIAESLKDKFPGKIDVLHRQGKQGLGTAYIQGFGIALEKGAQEIVQMDADFSHDPLQVVPLLDSLKEFDMVLGSRYIKGGMLDEKWGVWRKGLSSFGNLYARAILGLPVLDVTGGFRAWRRETLLGLPLDRIGSQGYAFQVEMAYVTHILGYSIKELPIYFADRERGDSKMSLGIQVEAAKRVWSILYQYRDLNRKKPPK